jgi:hypothetical protein
MYLPAVPPGLVQKHSLHLTLTRQTASITVNSHLQLRGEFMMCLVDLHRPSTLLKQALSIITIPHQRFWDYGTYCRRFYYGMQLF